MEKEIFLTREVCKNGVLKNIKSKTATSLLDEGTQFTFEIDKKRKMKLCSKDRYDTAVEKLLEKYNDKENPIIIGHVGGFFEMASLTGNMTNVCKKGTRPYLLFFDKNPNNIQNAIFNTLLIKLSSSKERFLVNLFNLSKIEILECFNKPKYNKYVAAIEGSDEAAADEYLTDSEIDEILKNKFSLRKLESYIIDKKKYNADDHYKNLLALAKAHLSKEMLAVFKKVARNVCGYLDTANNYKSLAHFLMEDIRRNKKIHILNNNDAFQGFKSLISYTGIGNIKFLPNIDISKDKELKTLEQILINTGIIGHEKENKFPIDIVFVPNLYMLQNIYPFIKKNAENYIVANRNSKYGFFETFRTASLDVKDAKSIGAEEIVKDREARIPLNNLVEIESEKGFPLLMFMAGSHFGNIYHSERDTLNMIDMAIENKVDTVYIRGLFYSTYYHNQTSRRLLIDPNYPTLDSRLKAARSLIKRLNDSGIKVVYQMSDEEENLYQDMFRIYTREQGVTGNDFLAREDVRSRYDWVKPLIKQELIPYMIRKGEDVSLFNTDEATETRVGEMCEAIKAYYDGVPLGDLAQFIDPAYLKNDGMFRIVSETIDSYSIDDPSISVDLKPNTMFSKNTQYGDPTKGIKRYISSEQSGTFEVDLQEKPQLVSDLRQGIMEVGIIDDQFYVMAPQMIKDEWAAKDKNLLPGIKENILEDPSHKRTTQIQNKMNCPGGWIITGDAREILKTVPYFKRSKEVMEYVQKTGEGLPKVNTLYFNDLQIGSPTERISYLLKALDYAFYEYNIKGIFGVGDFHQGWNYAEFPLESRHLASSSVSQQMVDLNKLIRPWMEDAFGVIKPHLFEVEDDERNIKIDEKTNYTIIRHLIEKQIIKVQIGMYSDIYSIHEELDYETVDLELPQNLKVYESIIREKLCYIHNLWFLHLVEGNHEKNTDWDHKGYKLIEHLYLELENLKRSSGSNMELVVTEYFANYKGDIVLGSYGSKTINGYNIAYAHDFRSKNKGSGGNPIIEMSNYFDQMGTMSNPFHRAIMGHLHIFQSGVYNNKYLSIVGGSAGQSGYEQRLGYKSQPTYVIDCYLEDGRIMTVSIGEEFLKNYQIQNPHVKEVGLDNYIEECLKQDVHIYGAGEPTDIHMPLTRKLRVAKPHQIIGPNIPSTCLLD